MRPLLFLYAGVLGAFISAVPSVLLAACPAASLSDNDDMVLRFPAAQGVWVGSASLMVGNVTNTNVNAEGTLFYDVADKVLKLCDGDEWRELGGGGAEAAGDTGEIQFKAASGGLLADANLYWDNTTKRLGIGTKAPQTKLHFQKPELSDAVFLRMESLNQAVFDAKITESGLVIEGKAKNTSGNLYVHLSSAADDGASHHVYGSISTAYALGASTPQRLVGAMGRAYLTNGANVPRASGVIGELYAYGAGATGHVAEYAAFEASSIVNGGGASATFGDTYGVRLHPRLFGAKRYGIYQEGAGDINVFKGKIGAGIEQPQAKVHIIHPEENGYSLIVNNQSSKANIHQGSILFSSPKNTPTLFLGSTSDVNIGYESTVPYGVDDSGGNLRFNGMGVLWGDLGYYPKGGGAGAFGQFRFSAAASSIVSVPNAKVGVGSLYSAGAVGIGVATPTGMLDVKGRGGFESLFVTNDRNESAIHIEGFGAGKGYGIVYKPVVDTGAYPAWFLNASSALIGSITTSASATFFNTTSDYRLKENIEPMGHALDRVMALKPSQFNFKITPDVVVDGFIAHEVGAVLPYAVTGVKDAVDDKGAPIYQQVDYAKLTPLLTGAVQELRGLVDMLRAQNEVLSDKIDAQEQEIKALRLQLGVE